jgi:hypothetical protein
MANKLTAVADALNERVRRDVERKIRERAISQINDVIEQVVKDLMAKMQISLDADTLEVEIKFKD